MCNKIHCPKCGSTKVVAIDNESLANDGGFLNENHLKNTGKQFDNEIYFKFHCECNHLFTEALDIVVRRKKPKMIKLVVDVFVDGNFSELDVKKIIENADDALILNKNFNSKVISFIVSEHK